MIEPETRHEFRLTMAAAPDDTHLTVQVVIDSEASPAEPPVGISVNGSWPTFEYERTDELLAPVGPYSHHAPEHFVYEYTLPATRIEDGWDVSWSTTPATATKCASVAWTIRSALQVSNSRSAVRDLSHPARISRIEPVRQRFREVYL